jgi:hypothetical protein
VNKRGLISVAGLAVVALLIVSTAVASQPVRGFATYQVTVTSPRGQHSVLVNETVGSSSKTGYSDLVLQLIGRQQNFSYSRLVNASGNYFPFLPSLTNKSFDYSNGTRYSVHVSVTDSGTTTVKFKGSQYAMHVLVVTVLGTHGTKSFRANGTVETFPSTLVYSASAGNATAKVQAVLQATNLPLVSASPQSATAAVVGAGVGIGALALAGTFLIRRRDRKAKSQGEKPLHWVD